MIFRPSSNGDGLNASSPAALLMTSVRQPVGYESDEAIGTVSFAFEWYYPAVGLIVASVPRV